MLERKHGKTTLKEEKRGLEKAVLLMLLQCAGKMLESKCDDKYDKS